ncbi:MAG TPA: UTP--glucose-1-phosphate uridylyltransferase [Candidatus Sulfomarinibacteraceae bacterium]|nr:UTP--glucose-1-phosphate uridylyltransferase [Candidatus Sulfomarinibacteraceae bacterium]
MADERENFQPFARRMRDEGLPDVVIRTFKYYYRQLLEGQTGLIPESTIDAVRSVPDADTFGDDLAQEGEAALNKTVLVKLNGGLGTSMGLERPKSLLKVRHDLTFLDIIARQALRANVPLVLMNSFNTRRETLEALEQYPSLHHSDLPLDFLQHKVPKVRQSDLEPAEWPEEPEMEWCPPGHGDIYTALVTSGMLQQMLEAGYEYAFVSNSDNLGAVLDAGILGYFVDNDLPFLMEVADRTPADRKGGHLARLSDGRLVLRESAQCPEEDQDAFQDVERHRYFNTNNLWLHLPTLQKVLEERDGILGLPMIRNEKTVDPRDKKSYAVYQLETAMGSAISVFEGAGAVRVPRSRFAPVKTTGDLLAVRSDAFKMTSDYRMVMAEARKDRGLVVELDPTYYQLIDMMEARFSCGPPSLVACDLFKVEGDVNFGCDVVARGSVHIVHEDGRQVHIDDDTILEGDYEL